MSPNDTQEALQDQAEHPAAFPRLTREQMRRLEPLATCREFADGEYLYRAGDREPGFFVVSRGRVQVVADEPGEDGTEPHRKLLSVLDPGDFTGELQLVNNQPTMVSAVAEGPTRAMQLDFDALQRVLAEDSESGEIILRALLERRSLLEQRGVGVQLIGSRWSQRAFELKEFLTRSRVLHQWRDVENDADTERLLSRLGITPEQTPVVVCSNGPLMRNPSVDELAGCLGLRPDIDEELYDVAVVGAGPAGLAAAVYAASEGLRTLVVDAVAPGGQAGASSKIENYLGFPTGISGSDLANAAATQARKFGSTITSPTRAVSIECADGLKRITLEGGNGGPEHVGARVVILATGARYRKLDAVDRERFEQKGIYYGCTHAEASPCMGEEVVVVGGGNSAGQAAVFLCNFASKVSLLIRGKSLASTMSRYLIDRIERSDRIELRTGCQVTAFEGDQHLEAVKVRCESGEEFRVPTRGAFIMIGADPNTDWLRGCVALDDRGFVLTGREAERHEEYASHWNADRQPFLLETSRQSVFAVGDVRSGSIKRVASAVGEGAMAVKYIHEVLAT